MSKIDLAKRQRIMQRSMKLGHCICDPRRACPCDVFTNQGICPCAGERPDPVTSESVKLTEMVHNAGCASKIAPGDLEQVLGRLPEVTDPSVLSGVPAGDDAGIYKLTDEICLVQTVDVMTPCVDDPHTFGRICAANCLSDIYAMGGTPRTAVSILAFPAETLDGQIMYEMMKGAMEVFDEAGVALIGGHSIKDEEIKLGFAITGTIAPDAAVSHETARVGDLLVLTKPLGIGVLNFCRQIGRDDGDDTAVSESMVELNKPAAEAMNEVGVSAATDVTGFGLFGHLISMLRRSGVTAEIYADSLPAFAGAVEALRDGVVPGAVERNTEYVADDISVADDVDEALVHLGFDAQTSGGLLIAVPENRGERLMKALAARNVKGVAIGKIVSESEGKISVRLSGGRTPARPTEPREVLEMAAKEKQEEGAHSAECCADVFGDAEAASSTSADAMRTFGAFIRAAGAKGALDEKTKELINFALVVFAKCAPCIAAHSKKAKQMGITQTELDEAVWCAVAMGGAPTRMFYLDAMSRLTEGGESESCC